MYISARVINHKWLACSQFIQLRVSMNIYFSFKPSFFMCIVYFFFTMSYVGFVRKCVTQFIVRLIGLISQCRYYCLIKLFTFFLSVGKNKTVKNGLLIVFFFNLYYFSQIKLGAAIFTKTKKTAAVFLAISAKKWLCFCQFQYEVYNWQYFILHWQNYT